MAVLLGNISAIDCRLRHQLVLHESGGNLRQPVCSLAGFLDAKQFAMQADADHGLSARRDDSARFHNASARNIYRLRTDSRLGWRKDERGGKWPARRNGGRTWKVHAASAHLERWRQS